MAKVTFVNGMDSINREIAEGTPLSEVLTPSLKQVLGVGDSVEPIIDGVAVGTGVEIYGDKTVSFRAKSGSKGC